MSSTINTSKNVQTLGSFVEYCFAHPDQRFWQALRNWSGFNFITASNIGDLGGSQDTFYWRGKTK
jgi:hypothetical protein